MPPFGARRHVLTVHDLTVLSHPECHTVGNRVRTLASVAEALVRGATIVAVSEATREEALRAATMGGAYVMKAEDSLGSIEVGKHADFVVIPVDYMTVPAEDIWRIEPDMTVIGGDVVYTRPVRATLPDGG